MSKQIRQLMEYFTVLTNKYIEDEFDSSIQSKIKKIFKNEFQSLFTENIEHIPDELAARHAINPIFVIALKKALLEYAPAGDELKKHVMSIYKLIMLSFLERQKLQFEESDEKWGLFVNNTTIGNQQLYDNEYFKLEIIEADDTKYGFDLNRCYYYDIFKLNNHEDLGPILCEYDYLISDNLNEWIKFDRTKTIASGDSICNFRFQTKT
ncbi:MAG: L-2-amino-thiazoline-4-carboxylic acid hydrolase [Candidatus Kariarchaeaceae archaeon]